jgi:hypothetical protein
VGTNEGETMIIHEHNVEDAVHCIECNTDTNFYRLLETMYIQKTKWFLLEFFCGNCHNAWLVWGGEILIGGDVYYKLPYTWEVEQDAS